MKIALISPPIRDFYSTSHRLSALGLYSLQEVIQAAGHNSHIFNFPLQAAKGTKLRIPGSLDYLIPYLSDSEKGSLCYFKYWQHFGPPISTCAEEVLHYKPDIIFIACFAFAYADTSLLLAEELKKHTIPMILGGAGASVFPDYFRTSGLFHLIFTGEAEALSGVLAKARTPAQFLEALPEINTEPDNLPIPVLSRNLRRNKIIGTTMLTRGCPRRCRFCSNHLTQGKHLRVPSHEATHKLAEQCRGLTHLNIEDDNLLLKKSFFFNFIESVKQVNSYIGFSAENGLDYSQLTVSDAEYLIRNGFRQFNFSLAVTKKQEKENRFYQKDHLEILLDYIHSRQIPVFLYFIAGLEHDDPESMVNFLAGSLNFQATMGISLFYPVPGLSGFECNQDWDENKQIRCRGSAAWPWNNSLSTKELITAFRLTRLVNFIKLSPTDGISLIKKMITKGEFLSTDKKSGEILPIQNLSCSMLSAFFDKTEKWLTLL